MFAPPQRGETVFDNKQALNTTAFANPIGRTRERNQVADALQPLLTGRKPENLFIYGGPGTGKTTCVQHVCTRLEDEASVETVAINCWKYSTRASLLTQLLIELGYPVPRKGKPVDELLNKLREWIDKHHQVVVVLDEFDQHKEQDEVVYNLHELAVETDGSLGLVLISNRSPQYIDLEPRCLSRLGCRSIHFAPYDTEELTRILRQRAQKAFRRNVLEDNVIDFIAENVIQAPNDGSGDCRRALELLYRTGREADKEHADKVTISHAERALNQSQY